MRVLAFGLVGVVMMAAAAACSSSDDSEGETGEVTGPLMRPGQNCLRCHFQDSGFDAPIWSAGGTVYPAEDSAAQEGVSDVRVILEDDEGKVVELTTNAAGNFYTDEPLADLYWVSIEHDGERADMPVPVPAGSCNACHSPGPVGGAFARIVTPSTAPESQASCDGANTVSFPGGSDYDCSPYACDDSGCLRGCEGDEDCATNFSCTSGRCRASPAGE